MTTHIVMMRFHDTGDTAEAARRLRAMTGRIPGMTSLRIGTDDNRGPHAFDLVLISEHEDHAALQAYASHPVHKEVLGWLADRIKDRAVVDSDDC